MNYLKSFLCCILLVNTISENKFLHAYLSIQEEKKTLEKFKIPSHLQQKLDLFFTDTRTYELFINRQRRQFLPKLGVRRFPAQQRIEWTNEQVKIRTHWDLLHLPLYEELCKSCVIQPLAGLNKNTFILTSHSWPNYVVKINKNEWLDFNEQGIPELVRYKNISRVFYNDKIHEFIEKYNPNHIYAIKKYLYHLPGKPLNLSDRNYCVVAERVYDLPTSKMSKLAFGAMFNLDNFEVKKEYTALIQELVQLVFYTGIADLRPHNIFLIDQNGVKKILIIDTERHGYFDTDKHFFHKNETEVKQSALRGLFNFCHFTLCLPERTAYQMVTTLHNMFVALPKENNTPSMSNKSLINQITQPSRRVSHEK